MKRKLKVPVLLLAIVIMLSIFYIKEANSNPNLEPVVGDDLDVSVLNPEFTEARINRANEVSAQILEWEGLIAEGSLSADKVLETTLLIDDLKNIRTLETALEISIASEMEYDDVLVILNNDELIIDVYTENEVDSMTYVSLMKMGYQSFGDITQNVSVVVTHPSE